MKVLMFGWEFPPFITGGLGTACHGLSTSLARLVTRITFVLPKLKGAIDADQVHLIGANEFPPAPPESEQPLPLNVEIHTLDAALKPYITAEEYHRSVTAIMQDRREAKNDLETPEDRIFELTGDYGADLVGEVVRYAQVARRIALSSDFDVIHAHDWMTYLAGVEAKRVTGRPLVVHVHALEFDRSGDRVNQQVFEIERFGMEQADRVIAVSRRTRNLIIGRYDIDPAKVEVVYNGVGPSHPDVPARLDKSLEGRLVVFLGRITMQKGPEYFIEAAYLVSRKMDDVRFVMAGDGDMLPRMIERMAELGLQDRFHFTGFLEEKRRERLFAMADLFVLTSVSEPFGIAPVEALKHDVPVILSKQSGVAEVLTHAIKVDFWDVRKIADAMINVLSHGALARQMREGSRGDLDAISWDISAHQVHDIYRKML